MPLHHLDDIPLHYEIHGEGEPILFIHGLGSSGRDWQEQVDHFSRACQTITVDVRGHGRSGKPPGPYSVGQFAADIASLIEFLGVAPLHLVGISMGGMIAFQLAVDSPALLRSLVIVNSGPEMILPGFKGRLQLWQRLLIVRLLGMRKMGEVLGPRLFPKPEQENLRVMFVQRWAENDSRAYSAAMKALVGWSVAGQIKDIRCPTLVLAADQDYTPVAAKEAYVRQIPGAKLVVIEDSRHALPAERPEAFNQALQAFLAELASQERAN